jgi:peptidoglycan hydrolase-like protein with peptidoglycan-binding domain
MTMKQFMLATVASLALTLPAMAAQNMQPNATPAPTHRTQMNDQDQSAQNGQQNQRQAENVIRPSQLSKKQVRQIQESLNKKGFDAKHADGIWGPETAQALRTFQKQNGLQGHGQLTQQSLAQLGVMMNTNAEQGSATTGAGSHESGMNQPSQNPGMTNPDRSGSRTNGQGSDTTGQGQNNGASQMNESPGQSSGSMNNSAGSTSK